MNYIKLFLLTLGLTSCLLLARTNATAHVAESNGSIGAVLHVDPDDDPIAGEVSTFFFEIKDKTNRFSENACKCRLVIEQNGSTIYDELYNKAGGGTYTFPARGIYTVKAVGTPIKDGAFDAFSLGYDIRVERGADQISGATNASNSSQVTKLIGLLIGIIVLFFAFAVIRYKIVHNIK